MPKEPLDLTVGPHTQVRVHVSSRPKTVIQALTESLHNAQREVREGARQSLQQTGERYVAEQSSKRGVAKGKSAFASAGGGPAFFGTAADAAAHANREPFYPPPNKTHGLGAEKRSKENIYAGAFNIKSHRPGRSLRQGVADDYEGSRDENLRLAVEDLEQDGEEMGDSEAIARHYEDQLRDLQRTVDGLR
jgi:hypothetical protein